MADQTVNGNGMKRGFEQVMTYLIGAGIVGIIVSLWALNGTVATLAANNNATDAKVNSMAVNITQLSLDVGELKGRFDQYSNDNQRANAASPALQPYPQYQPRR
jgi:hypothetical protein